MIKCVLITHILSCSLGSGKLYIWYPNKLVFAHAKMPPSPHLHGGIKTLPFLKKSKPKKPFPSPVASRKNVFFEQAKRLLLLICQSFKFSSWFSTNRWSIPAIYHYPIP